MGYPDAWQAGQAQPGGSLYMIPRGGIAQDKKGGAELLRGLMIDYYVPQAGNTGVSLDAATQEFLEALQKGDPNLKQAERPQRVEVGGKPALRTRLMTKTSLQQEPDQVVYLYTVARTEGLWYMVQAAQPSILDQADPVFKQVITTVTFPN